MPKTVELVKHLEMNNEYYCSCECGNEISFLLKDLLNDGTVGYDCEDCGNVWLRISLTKEEFGN
jgi:uncharacterized Zn finger protein